MKDRRTRLAVALAPLFIMALTGAHAAEPVLRVVTDTGGGSFAERNIRVNRLAFVPGSKLLTATSRAGNITCGTPGPTTGMLLNLDGVNYPLVTSGLPAGLSQPITYNVSASSVSLGLNQLPGSNCVSSHVFGTGTGDGTEPDIYDLKFTGQSTRTVAEAVYFDVNSRALQIRVAQPILCTSYGSGGLTAALADPNNPFFVVEQAELLPGLAAMDYKPATLTMEPTSMISHGGPVVQCTSPGAAIAPTPGVVPSSVIFGGGFEPVAAPIGKPDVQVTLEDLNGDPLSAINAIPGQNIDYRVRIENIGNSPAMGMRLREFVPLPGGVSPSAMAQGGNNDSCELIGGASSACGLGSLTFPIKADNVSLQPGQTLLFTLSRRFADGVQAGAAAQAGYAAFVSPMASGIADANITDNGRWLELTPIANLPPVIGAIAMDPLAEGDVGALVTGTTLFTITDPENNALTVLTATSDDQVVLPNASVTVAPTANPNEYQLSVTPAADQNGDVSVTVTAGDGNSLPVTQEVLINIDAINDPPVFTLKSLSLVVPACSGTPPCNHTETDFVSDLAGGPPTALDELGQQVTVDLLQSNVVACSNVPTGFFGGLPGPQLFLNQQSGDWNLDMLFIGSVSGTATCQITVREVLDTMSSTTLQFTITYP